MLTGDGIAIIENSQEMLGKVYFLAIALVRECCPEALADVTVFNDVDSACVDSFAIKAGEVVKKNKQLIKTK